MADPLIPSTAWVRELINGLKNNITAVSPAYTEANLLISVTVTPLTSGSLVIGDTYIQTGILGGSDDFTNVANVIAGVVNVQGVVFIATGTTPTTWSSSTALSQYAVSVISLSNNIGSFTYQITSTGIVTGRSWLEIRSSAAFTNNKTIITNPLVIPNEASTADMIRSYIVDSSTIKMNYAGNTIGGNNNWSTAPNVPIRILVYP